MEKMINLPHESGSSCVVENYGEVFTFHKQGVADLYDMVTNRPCFLKDASIADKVVGKAATLMIPGDVKKVYAQVISLSALILLRNARIETDFRNVVPFIRNRFRTDWCPLERRCYDKKKSEEILPLIKDFMKSIKELHIQTEWV
ncbi:MAG: DUF1893 domain-containing protein [Bacteroides sp.]|nr:DUF1893 domain-containing protein [Bacteroides sp.]